MDIHLAVKFSDAFIDKTIEEEDGEIAQPNKILRMAFKQDPRRRHIVNELLKDYCRRTPSGRDADRPFEDTGVSSVNLGSQAVL